MREVKTTCPYCGVGCGIVASVAADGAVTLGGDPSHPANFGRLCSKGAALGETLTLEGRLLHPEIRGRRVDWETALNAVAQGFRRIIDTHGPDAVGFYLSGQLLTEDYYVANKLMKGFIGSANVDTNSRLCMASAVAGYKRAFGADAVPCSYEDIERAKLIVLVGSNAAWCHPVLFRRIASVKEENPDLHIVVIDPRRTPSCEIADLHLAITPGTDLLLFNGLLAFLAKSGELDPQYIAGHTTGFDEALAAARIDADDIEALAAHCGLTSEQINRFYRLFARTERVVTLYSQGVNQSMRGTDNNNVIINCHLATGRIGRPGMGPFSLTGQPNAMGGREVGGLANQLAAHMDFTEENCARVQRFWGAPTIARRPGLKAVDMFQAMEAGRIKALWIMGTNPAVSLPDSASVRRALEKCEWVVISDVMADLDTARLAHVRLPALAWGEKEGTVTNSERRISRQRSFLPAPGEARADGWIVSEIARRLGHGSAFSYENPAWIFREHAALSALDNGGSRAFDIGALADRDYDSLTPVQWPVTKESPCGTGRLFSDGKFFSPDGKARFVAIPATPRNVQEPDDLALTMNSGRVRDQWHTMTRTGLSPRLSRHTPEPTIHIHSHDAQIFGLMNDGFAVITTPRGTLVARVRVDDGQRVGDVFVPMHWNACFASRAGVNELIAALVDPISGQPELKKTRVAIRPFHPPWQGVLVSAVPVTLPAGIHWSRRRGEGIWIHHLAGEEKLSRSLLRSLLPTAADWERSEYVDESGHRYRAALWKESRLLCYLSAASDGMSLNTDWIEEIFHHPASDDHERMALLAGRPLNPIPPADRIICACHNVGESEIRAALSAGCDSVSEIGKASRAGTGCGGCIPELTSLLAEGAAACR